jgi:integrase
MTKTRPILHHDGGVSLYAPTPTFASYRLVWRDPFTGGRPNRRFGDRASAEAAFEQAVAYVRGAASVTQKKGRRSGPPTVDELFTAVEERWRLKGRKARYIEKRQGVYRTWIRPTCGSLTVLDWGSTDEHCLRVIAAARNAGRADATIQNIGALLRLLVSTAWARKMLPGTTDPMRGVEYVAGRSADDEAAVYVPPTARPTTTMVQSLTTAFDERGAADGRAWLGLMVPVAAFGGLRLGELTALRVSSYDAEKNALVVSEAWGYSVASGAKRQTPKNGRRRTVHLPWSISEAMRKRVAEVEADQGDDGLLFPGPKGATHPFTEGELRRVFERCARSAGWACEADGRTPKGQVRKGRPVIPWRNLRHHAAVWLHETAGYDWADVSRTLGHHSVAFTQARYVRPSVEAEQRNLTAMRSL